MVRKLTAKRGLVCPTRAVRDTVTHCTHIHTDAMAGALPLPTGTLKRLSRAVLLIAIVSTIIVPITEPVSIDAVSIFTDKMRWMAGFGGTAIVLIRSLEAVLMPITLPALWNADPIFLALEFILVAHPRRPGC